MQYDFSKCREGLHPFVNLMSQKAGDGEEKVVRWCPVCGAVVVDHDVDGRTFAGYYHELTYPGITKQYGLD